MGIEPTWDLIEPHTGFEDQERHQAASHLRIECERDPRTAARISASLFCKHITPAALLAQATALCNAAPQGSRMETAFNPVR